jgi:hypothetical protein
MTTTAGHSFYIEPIGSFYNQVNDTGSWEPLVYLAHINIGQFILFYISVLLVELKVWNTIFQKHSLDHFYINHDKCSGIIFSTLSDPYLVIRNKIWQPTRSLCSDWLNFQKHVVKKE